MPDNFDPSPLSNSDPAQPSEGKQRPKSNPNPWVEAAQTLGLSLLLAFGIRTFVAEARYIPSGSMLPTLEINDRLVIEKISYHFNPPKRGDIVVFWPPEEVQPSSDRRDAFIKRVVGLPGEEVAVSDGKVYINGVALEESYIRAAPDYTIEPGVVPEDQYLVLGDNRNNSHDSSKWKLDEGEWGFVPKENLIGRAVVRFWPPNRVGGLD